MPGRGICKRQRGCAIPSPKSISTGIGVSLMRSSASHVVVAGEAPSSREPDHLHFQMLFEPDEALSAIPSPPNQTPELRQS